MSARYELIDAEKATVTPGWSHEYSIVKMCEWLERVEFGLLRMAGPAGPRRPRRGGTG